MVTIAVSDATLGLDKPKVKPTASGKDKATASAQ